MIVGCYTLDLYCDGASDCRNRKAQYDGSESMRPPARYIGETGSECRTQARKDGWLLNLKYQTAICRKCAKAGLKPEES